MLDPADYPKLVERYRVHYLLGDQTIELFAGARDLLDDLRGAGYRLAVATGKSRVGLDRALQAVEAIDVFDITRCADETFSKPHPQMLREVMDGVGSTPERTVMIGDTTHDLQMALNAGTSGIAVTYGAHAEALLLELSPRFCAHSVAELGDWLATHA